MQLEDNFEYKQNMYHFEYQLEYLSQSRNH